MCDADIVVPECFTHNEELSGWYLRALCAKYVAQSLERAELRGDEARAVEREFGVGGIQKSGFVGECACGGAKFGKDLLLSRGGFGFGGSGGIFGNSRCLAYGQAGSGDITCGRVAVFGDVGQEERVLYAGTVIDSVSGGAGGDVGCVGLGRGDSGVSGGDSVSELSSEVGDNAGKLETVRQCDGDKGSDVTVEVIRGRHYAKNRATRLRRRAEKNQRDSGGFVHNRVGPNHARNVANRLEKKQRKKERRLQACDDGDGADRVWRSARVMRNKEREGQCRAGSSGAVGHFSDLSADDQRKLKESYATRLQVENELKIFRARQQLELEKAKDISQLKKRQETQIMRQTELNKVQVEKAFMQLSRAGSVPGVSSSDGSSARSPVFSGVGSGSISPNSSVSHAEILELKKSDLSKTHEIGELRARLDKLKIVNPQVYKELGFEREIPPTVGSGVTVDEHGNPIIGGFEDDSSLVFGYDGYIGEDGRFHFGENPAIYDA